MNALFHRDVVVGHEHVRKLDLCAPCGHGHRIQYGRSARLIVAFFVLFLIYLVTDFVGFQALRAPIPTSGFIDLDNQVIHNE